MKRSETIAEISKSLSHLQGEIHDGIRDSKGGHGKYADLPQLLQIVRPLLLKYKLSFTQHPSVDETNISLTSLLAHESGEWIESTLLLKIPPARGANESQAVGSGITYARRYALSSIFGISQEDDDGQYKKAVAPSEPCQDADETNTYGKAHPVAQEIARKLLACFTAQSENGAKDIISGLSDSEKKEVGSLLDKNTLNWIKGLGVNKHVGH
tara:strand:- start:128 stop:763 length:636 start_codon:yes stop_codon:yes gene_type:complete